MAKSWIVGLVGFVLFLCSQASQASDSLIRWRGFLTAGYAESLANTKYLNFIGTNPNFLYDTRLGIALNSDVTDSIEVSGQFIAQGSSSTFSPDVDWAYLKFRPSDSFMVQAGRIRFPMWLISDYYYVGYSYIWARPPPELYNLNLLSSFFGALANYSYLLPSGSLSFSLYGGSAPLNLPSFSSVSAAGATTRTTLEGSFERLIGLTIGYESLPLVVRLNYAQTHAALTLNTSSDVLPGTVLSGLTLYTQSLMRVPFEGRYQFWSVGIRANPLEHLRIITEYFGAQLETGAVSKNGYITVGVPLGRYEPHFTVATAGDVYTTSYYRYALGFNMSVAMNTLLKIQWEAIDVKVGNGPLSAAIGRPAQVVSANINLVF